MTPDKPAPDPARIAELKRRLAKEPASRSFIELAREYHEGGQFEEAAAVCAQGLKYHPHYLSARVLLGRIYFDMGRIEDARKELESVLENAPDNLVARKLVAEICLEQGDTEGALDRLRALLAFNPADADARARIGDIERKLKEKPDDPSAPGPQEPAAAAAGSGPSSGAAPAGTPSPSGAPAQAAMASRSGAPDPSGAEVPASTPAAPGPLDSGILATPTLAEIYMQQGHPDRAAQVYREILKGDPANVEVRSRIEELERVAAAPPDPALLALRRKIESLKSWREGIRRAAGRPRSGAGASR